MKYNYYLVDSNFINKLDEENRDEYKKFIYEIYKKTINEKSKKIEYDNFLVEHKAKYKFIHTYCPYCKKAIEFAFPFSIRELERLKYCSVCGEENLITRFERGIKKIDKMIKLSENCEEDLKIELNQQIIVLITSTLEIYLRDYYVTFLNMKIIKSGISKVELFKRECKNDFLNIDKANTKFKKQLNIDMKKKLDEKVYQNLKELSAYRNVIVHNNGICDKQFINLKIKEYSLHENIIVNSEELVKFKMTIINLVESIQPIYEKVHLEETIKQLNEDIREKYIFSFVWK